MTITTRFRIPVTALLAGVTAVIVSAFALGCASTASTTTTAAKPATVDVSAERVAQIRSWMTSHALEARSLTVSGSVTVDQNGSSQTGGLELKSKRLDESSDRRIDSLSVVISGPFGFTIARFLASPERYQMNDLFHGTTMTGATDAKSLQHLTQLNGVTLSMMSDLIYGLAPDAEDLNDQDSTFLISQDTRHMLIIYRRAQNATEIIDLRGVLPEPGAQIADAALTVTGYRRWNGIVADPQKTATKPAVNVHYSDTKLIGGVVIPQKISATAGDNQLMLEYSSLQVNPRPLTVRIKMPQ